MFSRHAKFILHLDDFPHLILIDDAIFQRGHNLSLEQMMPLQNLVGKGGGDNTSQERYDTDAHDGGKGAHLLANWRQVRNIAIANRCQSNQRPQHRRRD